MGKGAVFFLIFAPSLAFAAVPLIIAAAFETLVADLVGVAVSVIVFWASARAWRLARQSLGMK